MWGCCLCTLKIQRLFLVPHATVRPLSHFLLFKPVFVILYPTGTATLRQPHANVPSTAVVALKYVKRTLRSSLKSQHIKKYNDQSAHVDTQCWGDRCMLCSLFVLRMHLDMDLKSALKP